MAPWCLKAVGDGCGCGCEIEVLESDINERAGALLSEIYAAAPDVIAYSCYIWNIELVSKIAPEAKKLLPSAVTVLGGPEVSFEKSPEGFPFADYIIRGAGEDALCGLLKQLADGEVAKNKNIDGGVPDFAALPSPFTEAYYRSFQNDKLPMANRLVYYESARGCPFSCAYCLSCASRGVQYLPLARVKSELRGILSHGAKCVKFVDRTFNADKKRVLAILEFILTLDTDCVFHFEAAGDLFDEELLRVIGRMPAGRVQFEIGVQSVNRRTLEAAGRQTDTEKVLRNIRRLTERNNCHIHVDLIAGLPEETPESFAEGIRLCLAAKPHRLQIGFLKFLKGTPIREQIGKGGCLYTDYPPYEILQSPSMSYEDLVKLKGIEETVNKYYNSGMFRRAVAFASEKLFPNGYDFFEAFAEYCRGKNTKLSLKQSYTVLLDFLTLRGGGSEAAHCIKLDCLTFDPKGALPDAVAGNRVKTAEAPYRGVYQQMRAEYFDFDGKTRLFVYDKKDPVTGAFQVMEL